MEQSEIITAISTAPGIGGIAIVRTSGNGSIELVDSILKLKSNKKLFDQKANTIHLGSILDDDSNILDEVLVSIFRNPNSFTGEDSVEIACHGSQYIQQSILHLLIKHGARLALAGEFTQRAFFNGKMDLSQAESVADLIASSSASTHRLAMNQMRGGFSHKLIELRTALLNFTSLVELELDFSEEDVEFVDRVSLKNLAISIEEHINKLSSSFILGNAIKNGFPVAIVGETNAGKSTLLNLLLHEEKAIVSNVHGTTRDFIEDTISIQGQLFRLIDTAGIRETSDAVEILGIERTFKKLEQANIILWVVDAATSEEHILNLFNKIKIYVKNQSLVMVFNKVDVVAPAVMERKKILLADEIPERLFISAKYREGIDDLEKRIIKLANIPDFGEQDVVVTNMRHYEALENALTAIRRVIFGLDKNISGDFLSQDIRECMHYLGEITGQISTDDILGNIFSKFCIGK